MLMDGEPWNSGIIVGNEWTLISIRWRLGIFLGGDRKYKFSIETTCILLWVLFVLVGLMVDGIEEMVEPNMIAPILPKRKRK